MSDTGSNLSDFIYDYLSKIAKANADKSYDVTGTVTRVEDGIAFVKFENEKIETPVEQTISVKPGDIVKVRVSERKAWIIGNSTVPPTGDAKAIEAATEAGLAKIEAAAAQKSAAIAEEKADDAIEAATVGVDQKLSAYDAAVQEFTNLLANAYGMYRSEIPDPNNPGAFVYALHNAPTYETSTFAMFANSNGLFMATRDDVDDTWTITSALASDGSALVNILTAVGINAEWIKTGTLTLGGMNNTYGVLHVLNEDGELVGEWDKDGIDLINRGYTSTAQLWSTVYDPDNPDRFLRRARLSEGALWFEENNWGSAIGFNATGIDWHQNGYLVLHFNADWGASDGTSAPSARLYTAADFMIKAMHSVGGDPYIHFYGSNSDLYYAANEHYFISSFDQTTQYRLGFTVYGNARVDKSTDSGATWATDHYLLKTTENAKGIQTPNTAGYTTDDYGNPVHQRSTNTDTWNIKNNAGTNKFSVNFETGETTMATPLAISQGGTGATTRLAAFKNITNQNVGSNAQYFVTLTQNWASAGYSSKADVLTALNIKCPALWSGGLSAVNKQITFTWGGYNAYIIGGTAGGTSYTTVIIPANDLRTSQANYLISDESAYVTFGIWYNGSTGYLKLTGKNGSGSLAHVWGMN